MTDPSLMRGDDWVRCCICGELHKWPFGGLYRDTNYQLHDVCRGECATGAGFVVEPSKPWAERSRCSDNTPAREVVS